MKILSIGNSFSQDAQRYLRDVCDAAGVEIKNTNLYVGGCTLERHYNNMINGYEDYRLEEFGNDTGRMISLKEALLSDDWDIVTLQEASIRSTKIYNYEPYISELAKYVRKLCPNAKIALHVTWAYCESNNTTKNLGFYRHTDMFSAIEECYAKIKEIIGADILIPSGKTVALLYDKGYTVHRDGQHVSYGIGRYALALTWLKVLFGVKVRGNGFRGFPDDVIITEEEISAAQSVVDDFI